MYQQNVYGFARCCPLLVYFYIFINFIINYKFCVAIYLSTKICFIGGSGGRGLTSTLCICIVLL